MSAKRDQGTESQESNANSTRDTLSSEVGVGSILLLAAFIVIILYTRPSYLYRPLSDDFDDKNSDVVNEDYGTEVAEDSELS